MPTMDANAPVRLRTGTEVPASVCRTTWLALTRLAQTGEIADVMALYEIRELAADPGHQMWPGTPQRLQGLGLLDHAGQLNAIVRDVVLAAVTGGTDVRLVSPFTEEDQS